MRLPVRRAPRCSASVPPRAALLLDLRQDDGGQGVVPYALIAAVMALGALGAASVTRDQAVGLLNTISERLHGAATNATSVSAPAGSGITSGEPAPATPGPPGLSLAYEIPAGLVLGRRISVVPTTNAAAGQVWFQGLGLPPWMMLDTVNGTLLIDPAAPGPFVGTIYEATADGRRTYTVISGTVLAPGEISYPADDPAMLDFEAWGSYPPVTNLPAGTVFSIQTATTWLMIDPDSGVLVGIPQQAGEVVSATVTATSPDGRTAQTLFSAVVNAPPTLAYSGPATSLVGGQAAFLTPTLTNMPASGVSYSLGSGDLPAGMTLDPATGVVGGTPTQPGSGTFWIWASSTDQREAYAMVPWSVAAPP